MKSPDADLIERAKALDPGALSAIYERYFDGIYRYVYARLGHQSDAEDVAEQVFVKMVDALPQYRIRGVAFSSWLYRIAHNLVIDRYRRAGRQPVELGEHVRDGARSADPEAMAQAAEDRALLRHALGQLTPEQQQLIALRFLDNREVSEVAEMMGRRPGAIHSMQHRALASLQRLMRADNQPLERVSRQAGPLQVQPVEIRRG